MGDAEGGVARLTSLMNECHWISKNSDSDFDDRLEMIS